MRSAIKVSAILFALGGGLGVVMGHYRAATVDQTVGLGAPQQAAIVDDFDIETTGSINLAGSSRPFCSYLSDFCSSNTASATPVTGNA